MPSLLSRESITMSHVKQYKQYCTTKKIDKKYTWTDGQQNENLILHVETLLKGSKIFHRFQKLFNLQKNYIEFSLHFIDIDINFRSKQKLFGPQKNLSLDNGLSI